MERSTTIADALAITDIRTDGSFDYSSVLDLRCTNTGSAMPIEETTLKRLQNHFVEYDQMPIMFTDMDEKIGEELTAKLKMLNGKTLVVTNEISKAARFLDDANIPFNSKILYIVETGKGDTVRDARVTSTMPTSAARFGTFAG